MAAVIALTVETGVALARLGHAGDTTGAAVAYGFLLAICSAVGPNRPEALATVLAGTLGATVYGLTLHALAIAHPGPVGDEEGAPMTRRGALAATAGALVALLGAGTALGALLEPARRRARFFALREPDRPAPTPGREPFPRISGRPPEVTPAADHYVVDIDLLDPSLDVKDWMLELDGEVARPLQVGVEALQRDFELVEEVSVLTCISNEVGGPLVGSSRWTGVRLADLLQRAGVKPGAGEVVFRCADGYTSALTLAQARSPDVLLAIAQDGRPLLPVHGFPCRLRVPALYGMKNPKWLERIELRRTPFVAYWVQRGWSDRAVVRTMARIDVSPDARVGQPTWIAGVAWAGDRGVSAVEVSLDAGRSWRRARLQTPLSPLGWTQWAYRFVPGRPGVQSVQCRATDGFGRVQDATTRAPHPSGASGYHELPFQVT